MNVRIVVFLSLAVCFNASLVGMVHSKKGIGLLARSLVRCAHSNNDIRGPILTQKISGDSQGSITVPKKYEGSRISTNRAALSLITAFYVRGPEEQYAFLANGSITNCLERQSFKRVQQSMYEGAEICARNKKKLERLVAFFTMPDIHGTRFSFCEPSHSLPEYAIEDYKNLWLEPLQEVVRDIACQHNIAGDMTIFGAGRKNRIVGLFLHRDPKESHYFEKDPGFLMKKLNK